MVQLYCLRQYLGTETFSCSLLLRMARIDMDWNLKKSKFYHYAHKNSLPLSYYG